MAEVAHARCAGFVAIEEDLVFVGVVEAHEELQDRALSGTVHADNVLSRTEIALVRFLHEDIPKYVPRGYRKRV